MSFQIRPWCFSVFRSFPWCLGLFQIMPMMHCLLFSDHFSWGLVFWFQIMPMMRNLCYYLAHDALFVNRSCPWCFFYQMLPIVHCWFSDHAHDACFCQIMPMMPNLCSDHAHDVFFIISCPWCLGLLRSCPCCFDFLNMRMMLSTCFSDHAHDA